jgi:signal transduction histidine kinase
VNLAATARRIAGGDLDRPFVAPGRDEIAQLAASLEHMRQELQAKLAVVALQTAELRESSLRIVAAQDEERRRLARDLHDGIQQELVVLRMRLGLAEDASDPELLRTIGGELDQTIVRLREVSHDLYPAILRDRGVAAAVRSYASRLPVESILTVTPDPLPRVSMDVESGAYFLICESVTNALKHSGASELGVDLSVSDRELRVEVRDDGRGFEPNGLMRRGGLLHMEDRVRSFGGRLSIDSRSGAGTRVVATFPIPADPADPADPAVPAVPADPTTSSGAGERTAPPPPDGSYLVPR